MKKVIGWMAPVALLGVTLLPLAAQAQPSYNNRHNINARLHRQNTRIERGEATGQLTRRESNRVERRDARIQRQVVHYRHSVRGMTPARRRHVQRELNRNNRAIYRLKHNRRHRNY